MDRAKDNPWPEWPKVYRLDSGQKEAAAKFGADPGSILRSAKKFIGDDHGWVKEVLTLKSSGKRNDKGQFRAQECRHRTTASRATCAAGHGLSRP